jgi:hypothetical protein
MEREIPVEWIRLALEQPDLREADRITRGFRNFCHYALAAYLKAGGHRTLNHHSRISIARF